MTTLRSTVFNVCCKPGSPRIFPISVKEKLMYSNSFTPALTFPNFTLILASLYSIRSRSITISSFLMFSFI
ncbi:unnamed protein product [Schistosoma margrebowiei]|uniref:Uncharacterized protein n=1 Tax=Schistosoma margrebowiei TaxID=48269 RepID=A0A3P8DSJ9_9TREM|nr:unnamed protein product [Schistosoma margrebowiei]